MWLKYPDNDHQFRMMVAEVVAAKNRMSNRSGYSPIQRVFGIGHRLPADLCSDDTYLPDVVHSISAHDASIEEQRQIRLAAMKAHSEVSIRDRIDEAVRARYRVKVDFRPDDVVIVWRISKPAKKGKWIGPGVCIGSHKGSLWVNMKGSLWKCSQSQFRLATSEEAKA